MNLVILKGNLGVDPELKVTGGGQAVLNLRMVTTDKYLDRNNAWQERSEWHSVVLWGKRGESLAKHLVKGSAILVRGSLSTRSWESDGKKHYKTEIRADDIEFAGGKGADGGSYAQGGGNRPERRQRGQSQPQRVQSDMFAPPPEPEEASADDGDF